MTHSNIVDDVITALNPEDIPAEYIIMAKIVDHMGSEKILRGIELEKFLNNPNRSVGVAEARVILNVQKIRSTIVSSLVQFFDDLAVACEAFIPRNELD